MEILACTVSGAIVTYAAWCWFDTIRGILRHW